jgi:hypothetical protein
MENVFRGVLDSILLAEPRWWWWTVALLLAWRLMGSLLEPRVGAGGGGPVRSLQGELQTRRACPNCGWRRIVAAQVCPVCGLAPDESPKALPAPPDERRRKPRAEDRGG